jgi:hypothetical protein
LGKEIGAGAKGYSIQAFFAPAMLGAANAQAVGRNSLSLLIKEANYYANHNNRGRKSR